MEGVNAHGDLRGGGATQRKITIDDDGIEGLIQAGELVLENNRRKAMLEDVLEHMRHHRRNGIPLEVDPAVVKRIELSARNQIDLLRKNRDLLARMGWAKRKLDKERDLLDKEIANWEKVEQLLRSARTRAGRTN
jgi:hypothetical protein